MLIADALTALTRMLQNEAATMLLLEDAELQELLAQAAIVDGWAMPPTYGQRPWTANTAYAVGDIVRPSTLTDANLGYLARASVAGTSDDTEPTWPTTAEDETTDGGVTWVTFAYTWYPTFDLNIAAAEGWRRKAGKAVLKYDFSQAEGQRHQRSQIYDHCMTQAQVYANRIAGTIDASEATTGIGWASYTV